MKKASILLLPVSLTLAAMLVGCQENPASVPVSPPLVEVPAESNTLESLSPPQIETPDGNDTPLPSETQPPPQTIEPSQTNESTALPLITADMIGMEGMDKALFDGAVAFLGRQSANPEKMTIPYVGIFGQYESDGKINVVCHVGLEHFCYNEAKTALVRDGTIITFGRAILTGNDDGTYSCDDFVLAGDGAAEAKDLREFCGPLTGLPDEIYNGIKYTSTFPDPKETEAMYTQATGLAIQ